MRPGRGWLMVAVMLGACAAAPVVPESASPAAAPAAPLAGTRWVAEVGGHEGRGMPRLEFAPGGELHGYTGCNMLSGRWSETDGEVRLTALVVTKRLCIGPEAEVERQLLAALSEQSRVTREAGRLVVVSPQGARFEFAAAAAA